MCASVQLGSRDGSGKAALPYKLMPRLIKTSEMVNDLPLLPAFPFPTLPLAPSNQFMILEWKSESALRLLWICLLKFLGRARLSSAPHNLSIGFLGEGVRKSWES